MSVTVLLGAAYATLVSGTVLIRKTVTRICRPDNTCQTPAVLGGLLLLMLPFCILWVQSKREVRRERLYFTLHIGIPLAFLLPTTAAGLVYLFHKYWFTESFSIISGLLVVFLTALLGLLSVSTLGALRKTRPGDAHGQNSD